MSTHTPHTPAGDLSDWAEDAAFVAVLLVGAVLVAAIVLLFIVL